MAVLKMKAHVSYSQTTSPLLVTKGKRVTLVWQTPPSLSDKSVCHQQWDTSKLTRYNGKTQHHISDRPANARDQNPVGRKQQTKPNRGIFYKIFRSDKVKKDKVSPRTCSRLKETKET